jgi:hypothetical protein
MARSARRHHGGKRAVTRRRRHGDAKETATEVMTAMRLLIGLWELVQAIIREGRWLDGGPGRLL